MRIPSNQSKRVHRKALGSEAENLSVPWFPCFVYLHLDAHLGTTSGELQMRVACVYHQIRAKVSTARRSGRLGSEAGNLGCPEVFP